MNGNIRQSQGHRLPGRPENLAVSPEGPGDARVWSRRHFMGRAVSLASLGLLVAACSSQSGGSPNVAESSMSPGSVRAGATRTATGTGSGVDAELIAQRYRGLRPFPSAPVPPAVKPVTLSATHPGIFSRVPVSDKVVFVTIDDGLEKEPAFIQMVKDFQVPLTICLADVLIRDDYAYFAKLKETGYVSIQNHTVTHPLDMPSLSAARQLDEVAGQQDKLRREFGSTPYIFRPPGGNYDAATLDAVRSAGLKGMMLWREAMQINDMQYQTPRHALHPGDVILSHFRGPAQLHGETMVQMMIRLFRHIQDQGFTVADITKYV
jgi:peptidoglycan/xylan/chitin deacetylase (PgdA/CDA1 family)